MLGSHMNRNRVISLQRGFSLIESLAALVVLSVGMLGIAAQFVEGLKASRTAVYRTAAVQLASDMMERIRANPGAEDDYELAAAISTDCINGLVDCDETAIARTDILVWETEVGLRMPAGVATSIVVTDTIFGAASTNSYNVTLSWPEPGYESELSYTLMAQL
jgi:type IV pilus assembly protein PilV